LTYLTSFKTLILVFQTEQSKASGWAYFWNPTESQPDCNLYRKEWKR